MKYSNLKELLQKSKSSRMLFLSLPVETQCLLHKYNSQIHTANDLHLAINTSSAMEKHCILGHWKQERL